MNHVRSITVEYQGRLARMDLDAAISAYGASATSKLSNNAVTGRPEDQLRSPFNTLLLDLAECLGRRRADVSAVDETPVSDLRTRPDYAVTIQDALVGHVELKAPNKGADPRKFTDSHDKEQWKRLQSLPNVIYCDGNEFSLWRFGEPAFDIVRLEGDVRTSGNKLASPVQLLHLFETFLDWKPIPPKSAQELARVSARLCRLLRDEVTDQLEAKNPSLTSLADGWRKLLFPEATNEKFADGYAQAVTFGLLMARAKDISLKDGFHKVAQELGHTSTLIGAALNLLTYDAVNQASLKTSLQTLTRVLDKVDWPTISSGKPETWLYFYEDFLQVYDNKLRKKTGSYYTPPEVVNAMVRLVDEELQSPRFNTHHAGLASQSVTVADPATGTGTFLLGILRSIAKTVELDEGPGAVPGAINDALKRLIAFEMQLGPFAVAQLRILAEVFELTKAPPAHTPRMFVTNTLDDPDDDGGWLPQMVEPIADSRRQASKIKREEPITVVIGNPPYKEKALGQGAWVEGQAPDADRWTPLKDWLPPADWGVGAHAKHLRNLYVYFWRWATWKVFDHEPGSKAGIVCFITMAGFLNGPGFQRMREYMRQKCDRIWVIDCSPEGHQPSVSTRIFQGVQQPVCIVLASRSAQKGEDSPAEVRWRALPEGNRTDKFVALSEVSLSDKDWLDCPDDWRAPFLPSSKGVWSTFPPLENLFAYNGSGVMPGRTWVIAPDQQSLEQRWNKLIEAPASQKETLFHPHLRREQLGDKHTNKVVRVPLSGLPSRPKTIADETGSQNTPEHYAFRSFDRQWIVPDSRLINQPNPHLWDVRSDQQVFLTAFTQVSPSSGPAFTVTGLIPDLHHYKGSFGGRVFPLWNDSLSNFSNFRPALLPYISDKLSSDVTPEDLFAYIVAIGANPDYTSRFRKDLSTPGLRIPLTADLGIFCQVTELGRTIVWLHTFGERMADPANGRPFGPPRLPAERRPWIPADGAISEDPALMPDAIDYDVAKKRLLVGTGYVENVPVAVWNYEVSGKHVLRQWFSYRQKNRERPIIGDRRQPSPLSFIQPDHWLSEYTSELINVLNVLGWLVDLEPSQADLLDKVLSGPMISDEELRDAKAFDLPKTVGRKKKQPQDSRLFR